MNVRTMVMAILSSSSSVYKATKDIFCFPGKVSYPFGFILRAIAFFPRLDVVHKDHRCSMNGSASRIFRSSWERSCCLLPASGESAGTRNVTIVKCGKRPGVVDPLLTPRTRYLCFEKASETVSSAVDTSKRMENDDGGIDGIVYLANRRFFLLWNAAKIQTGL